MSVLYAGIDVAFRRNKHLPVIFCEVRDGRVVPIPVRRCSRAVPPRGFGNAATLDASVISGFGEATAEYLSAIAVELGAPIVQIAIDSPRAPCAIGRERRAAEVTLDRLGIASFATPTAAKLKTIRDRVREHLERGGSHATIPHSNQLWMLVGFALFERLASIAPCIEVYPQATLRVIGAGGRHKSQDGAVEEQWAAASRYTGWRTGADGIAIEECVSGAPHDQLDAYLAAWVAALPEHDRVPLGVPPDDVIWVPRVTEGGAFQQLDQPQASAHRPPRTKSGRPAAGTFAPRPMLCPACGTKEFVRWPWGWDAHAAHSCPGLSAGTPEERKQEYRRRLASYFSRTRES